VTFLTAPESQALIDAPPQDRWEGRRDRAMLILALQTGLRVSELLAVKCGDVTLGTGSHVRVEGKGRKQRAVPLTKEAQAVLTVWLAERGGQPDDPLFATGAAAARRTSARRWSPTCSAADPAASAATCSCTPARPIAR
jgi:site-specific recombinase XerC